MHSEINWSLIGLIVKYHSLASDVLFIDIFIENLFLYTIYFLIAVDDHICVVLIHFFFLYFFGILFLLIDF